MRWPLLIVAMNLVCCAGGIRVAFAGQFRFQDLERYYLRYCLAAPSADDVAQARLDHYAVQYGEKYFPVGSSVSVAVSAPTMAGAQCSVDDDPHGSPGFVCDWSRPDFGLDYLCRQVDWLVGIDSDKAHVKILGFEMNRGL